MSVNIEQVLSCLPKADLPEEVASLVLLRNQLLPADGSANCPDGSHSLALRLKPNNHNPFPGRRIIDTFPSKDSINQFTLYVFERRYGWSDLVEISATNRDSLKLRKGPRSKDDAKWKQRINELLDEFICWFNHEGVCKKLLDSFMFAISNESHSPVARQQTLLYVFNWIQGSGVAITDENFNSVKSLVCMGLWDVWSAIRSACNAKLFSLLSILNLGQVDAIFWELVKCCMNLDASWQAKEGSIMGINSIIRKFQAVTGSIEFDADEETFYLQFNDEKMDKLPEFITDCVRTTVYPLLAHCQLSIRENATKAFGSYLARTPIQEGVSALRDIVDLLVRHGKSGILDDADKVLIPAHRSLPMEFRFSDAFEAQGLLGVFEQVVKTVPSQLLIGKWPLYFSTLNLYLTHSASTVRQATSSVFKFFVAKSASDAKMLRLVLQSLSSEWEVDEGALESHSTQNKAIPTITDLSFLHEHDLPLWQTWEWREGRLLAYELIFQFLIKNHWLYNFGLSHGDNAQTSSSQDGDKKTTSLGGFQSRASFIRAPRHDPIDESGEEAFEEGGLVPPTLNWRQRRVSMSQLPLEVRAQSYGSSSISSPSQKEYLARSQRMRRMATISSESDSDTRPVAHYAQTRRRLPQSATRTTMSLLSIALQEEKEEKNCPDDQNDNSVLPTLPSLHPLSRIVLKMLYQTTSCLTDSRWELRRMANQVLPSLVEVLRWYKMDILKRLWDDKLVADFNSAGCPLGVIKSLSLSLSHASKLKSLIKSPPPSWQDVDNCVAIVRNIVDCIESSLDAWCDPLLQLTQRRRLDKIAVTALECLMVAFSGFPSALGDKREAIETNVSSFFKSVFCSTTSNQALKDKYAGVVTLRIASDFITSPMKMQGRSALRHAARGFLECVVHHLKEFCRSSLRSVQLFPILVSYCWEFHEDDQLFRALIESVAEGIAAFPPAPTSELDFSYIYMTLKQISICAALPSTDLTTLRLLSDIYMSLAPSLTEAKHLRHVFHFVIAKLSKMNQLCWDSPRTDHDLDLLSNDLKLEDTVSLDEFPDDDHGIDMGSTGSAQESQVLHCIQNSCSKPSPRPMNSSPLRGEATTPTSRETDDDWDDWSDDDEDQSALANTLSELLGKLRRLHGETTFFREMAKLTSREREIVSDLLKER